jgi:hypothetical protein
MSASLIAPVTVANEIDKFGQVVNEFLNATAVDTTVTPLSKEQFERTMVTPA